MNWDDIQYFLALATARSVRGAGTTLGVSHSTVLRRIEALEAELSTRLFDRNRDGWFLTEAGLAMFARSQRIETEVSALKMDLGGQDKRLEGQVSLTCCDSFIGDFLLEGLGVFFVEHPGIEPHFIVESRSLNLAKREADLAIRILGPGAKPPEYLIAKKIAPVTVATYRARLEPQHRDVPKRWIGFVDDEVTASLIAQSSYPNMPCWGSFSCLELAAQAAVRGLGWILLPTYVGDRISELERHSSADLGPLADLWMLCHPDLRGNARLWAVRDAVAEVFTEYASLFNGAMVEKRDPKT